MTEKEESGFLITSREDILEHYGDFFDRFVIGGEPYYLEKHLKGSDLASSDRIIILPAGLIVLSIETPVSEYRQEIWKFIPGSLFYEVLLQAINVIISENNDDLNNDRTGRAYDGDDDLIFVHYPYDDIESMSTINSKLGTKDTLFKCQELFTELHKKR